VGSRFTLRRTVTALAMGAAAAASLVITAPAAAADSPQTKLMRLLDACDKETFDAGAPGLCTVDAGSVTLDRFTADLQRGGSGAWWINNRKETVDAGDTLHVVNQGGILHTFTEVKTFGGGVIPPFNAAVNNAPIAVKPDGAPVSFADIGTSGVAPGTASLDVVPTKGVHNYQCIFHPWMRSVVTVR
jgi:plastocyanin